MNWPAAIEAFLSLAAMFGLGLWYGRSHERDKTDTTFQFAHTCVQSPSLKYVHQCVLGQIDRVELRRKLEFYVTETPERRA